MRQKLPPKSAFNQALSNTFGTKEFNHHEGCIEATATAKYSIAATAAAANRRDQWDNNAEINSTADDNLISNLIE